MHEIVCGSLKPDRDSPGQSAPQALRTDHVFICDQFLDGYILILDVICWTCFVDIPVAANELIAEM